MFLLLVYNTKKQNPGTPTVASHTWYKIHVSPTRQRATFVHCMTRIFFRWKRLCRSFKLRCH